MEVDSHWAAFTEKDGNYCINANKIPGMHETRYGNCRRAECTGSDEISFQRPLCAVGWRVCGITRMASTARIIWQYMHSACGRFSSASSIKHEALNINLEVSRDLILSLSSSTLLVFSTAWHYIYTQRKQSFPWPCLAVVRSRCDLRKALVRLLARDVVLPQLLQLLLFLCSRLFLVLLNQRR